MSFVATMLLVTVFAPIFIPVEVATSMVYETSPTAVGTNTIGSSVKLCPLTTVFENEVVDVNNPPAAQVAFIVTGP
ncbi:hypothetical protein, partial [Alistipes onderdonkii]|uniref:hypothetical protein n=1 Tax=Alistipes onderdonkii TaxID=328813 RepID=UPI0032C055BA